MTMAHRPHPGLLLVLLAAVVFVALLVPQAEANCLSCKTVVSSGLLVLRQFEANITAALDQYCDAPPAPLCNAAVNKTLPIVIEFTLHLLNSPAVEGNVTSHMDALCKALPPFFLNNCIENTVPKLYHAMVSLVEAVLTAPQLQDALSNDLKLFCEAPPPLLASICSGIINAVVDKVLNASPSNICKLLGKC